MLKMLGAIFAVVIIGVGITFLPAVKTITDAIFNTELVSTMDPVLQMFVGFWPIIILGFFVFGAYIQIKKGGTR